MFKHSIVSSRSSQVSPEKSQQYCCDFSGETCDDLRWSAMILEAQNRRKSIASCGRAITSTVNGKKFPCNSNINCQSSNLIYVTSCTHCGIQYVGQTKNRLPTRFQGHFIDINNERDTTVARHFNKCPNDRPSLINGFNITSQFYFFSPG